MAVVEFRLGGAHYLCEGEVGRVFFDIRIPSGVDALWCDGFGSCGCGGLLVASRG